MKKLLAVILALLTVICLFSACSGKDNKGGDTKETEVTEALTEGDYTYEILEDDTVKITGFAGSQIADRLEIPDTIAEKNVTVIGEKAFAQSEQFDYYDFSLIKQEVFVNQDDYYKDFEHMNTKGQKAFSKSFAEFLKLRDKGLNEGVTIDDLFYTKDEYVSSIDYISCIYFDAETTTEQGIELKLHAYTGSDVTVLYEVLVKAPENSDYKTIQEYSQTDTLIYSPEKHGNYLIRVNAKTPDSENTFDRYYEKKIYY